MTYWWNEIGDRISLFNLADICPKAWYLFCQCPLLESLDAPFADISSANEYKYR